MKKVVKKTIAKAQSGKKLTVARTRQVADSLDNVAGQKARAAISRTVEDNKGYDKISQGLNKSAVKDSENAARYRKLADQAAKKKKK